MRAQFETIRTEGGLLPADLLQRVRERDRDLGGLRGEDYGLPPNEPLNEAIVRSYNRLVGAWGSFREAQSRLPQGEPGTTVTRERWLLVLLQELGYGRVQTANAIEIEGKSYAVTHAWENVPIHLVGCNVALGTRTPGVAGAATKSPHATLQELLNRSDERLWGILSNGLQLRVLRDNSALTRQAYLEFDLEQMMDGDVYPDFALLWMLCHASRVEGEWHHECWLEKWSQEAEKQGTRALEGLRDGVEAAITALGGGFLAPGRNGVLKEALRAGDLSTQDYYRELLRLVYRLLFLFVAEDRGLLHDPNASEEARDQYARWYSTQRLRQLAERRRGTKHGDLWEGLKLVMGSLGSDEGSPALGLPPLGSFLWSPGSIEHLEGAQLANRSMLETIRALATVRDGESMRGVDYKNLGAEELGSVYESLLELHPVLDVDGGLFALTTAAGNERKTTGSYYTPSSLISALLDSALEPVLDEASGKGKDAILGLKVVDPACGSGHFLVAAAHRIAKRLASERTGEEEPAPEAVRQALRDVVSRCIYGVDINPMAVELCKVSLWMEALDPGRPLSFLDAHIKCGNSLLGTTSALMADGVPDDAFKPLEGDDKDVARSLKVQNKYEREGQLTVEDATIDLAGAFEERVLALEATDDLTVAGVHAKEEAYRDLVASEAHGRVKLAADAWCAAFVQRKSVGAPRITTASLQRLASGDAEDNAAEIKRLSSEYAFFHWQIEYPQVFGRPGAGFDCVLGNPPWERVKLQEKEFFAGHTQIAGAKNAAQRKQLIVELEQDDPPLFLEFKSSLRRAESESHLARLTGRFPLAGRGDVNTYGLFAELAMGLTSLSGRAGLVLPLGVATDDTNKALFGAMVQESRLRSLLAFENESFLFPTIHHATKFALLTTSSAGSDQPAQFAFFLRSVADLADPERTFFLTAADIVRLNPNTQTSPIFRQRRDAELAARVYSEHEVFVRDGLPTGNPWDVSFSYMIHMSKDASKLFSVATPSDERPALTPLYEGKMFQLFDHRFGTYEDQTAAQARQGKLPEVDELNHDDPDFAVRPRYWIERDVADDYLEDRWDRDWLIGWRRNSSNVSRRGLVMTVLPRVGAGDSLFLMFPKTGPACCLVVNCSTYVLDYFARQKLGGINFSYYVLEQLPLLPPSSYDRAAPWTTDRLADWITARALELLYTAKDLEGFAREHGYHGLPFRWKTDRRTSLRSELDAAFFHLYGLERDDVDYVMDTFWVVRDRDVKAHGEFRTKRLILEIYDELAEAIATGRPYQTRLDPPPADPRVAHPPRDATDETRGASVGASTLGN